jgi:predicted O-methyltransferase YrrM
MDLPLPPIVARAEAAARAAGFPLVADGVHPSCSSPHTGRLLAALAAARPGGRIGEIGTGTGYGTSWILSALPADAEVVTVEIDPGRAAAAQALFAGEAGVTVVEGDAPGVIATLGPFDLLFVDGAHYGGDAEALRSLIPLVRIGGQLVVDDVTPVAALPEGSPLRRRDAKREALLATPGLVGVEVVAPSLTESTLVATRTA